MAQQKPIGVRIHLPQTPEGMAAFTAAMARFNGGVLVGALNKLHAPLEEKKAYLAGLHGAAPWSKNEQEETENGKEKMAAG